MILSVIAISPENKLYGNSIMVEGNDLARHHLEEDIKKYTEPGWPKIFVTSEGPINVTT